MSVFPIRPWPTVLSLLLAATGAAAEETGAAQTFTFRFAPPDGVRYVQKLVTTRERVLGEHGQQVDRAESETAVTMTRVEDGYVMTATPTSMKMSRDGQPIQDPISELLAGMVITYRIGQDGQVQNIGGYDQLLEKIEATFPPEVATALAPVLSEETLVARETAEWNGRIGDFAGQSFAVGDVLEAEVPFTLPNGESVVYSTRTIFSGIEPCASQSGTCVRVDLAYDSDAGALAGMASDVASDVASAAGLEAERQPAASEPGARVSGTGSRLIDPQTMLIYDETLERTIRMNIDLPGQGEVPTTLTETRQYAFEY